MLEQIDHRGKRFTIDDDDVVDGEESTAVVGQMPSNGGAQQEIRELERAKAVAGPTGANPNVEVLDR